MTPADILPYVGAGLVIAGLVIAALVRRDDKAEGARRERDATAETARRERNTALDAALAALAIGQSKLLDIGTERAILLTQVHGDVRIVDAKVSAAVAEVSRDRHDGKSRDAAMGARLDDHAQQLSDLRARLP